MSVEEVEEHIKTKQPIDARITYKIFKKTKYTAEDLDLERV